MALLRFTCKDANVTIKIYSSNTKYNNVFQYRKNGEGDWSGFTSVALTPEDYIELKGNGFDSNSGPYPIFNISGSGNIEASGDVTSLLNEMGGDVAITKENQFGNMFKNCTKLTKAPELPSTTLATGCYSGMFSRCTSLTTAPVLPAATLADSCYYLMFQGCTSLKAAPELQASGLDVECYAHMFEGCTSLITASELPSTTLATGCYSFMFTGCTKLTTAPELPARDLTNHCYEYMFQGCTSLITAPVLPATTMKTGCYDGMFSGCREINYVKIGAETPSPLNKYDWLYGTASTGTLEVTNDVLEVYENDSSSLPTGWTLVRSTPTPDPTPDPTPSEPTSLDNVKVCGQSVDLSSGTAVVTIPEFSTFTIDAHGLVDENGDPILVKVSGASEVKVNESVQKSWTSKTITLTTVSSK